MNATKVTDAVARVLGVDHARFDELALEAPAGAGGLVLVPHLDGERTPNRPDVTGALTGLRTDVTAAQLARAVVEGVVCNLLAGADALVHDAAGGAVFLVGGAARSAAYGPPAQRSGHPLPATLFPSSSLTSQPSLGLFKSPPGDQSKPKTTQKHHRGLSLAPVAVRLPFSSRNQRALCVCHCK